MATLTKKQEKANEAREARESLLRYLKPGTTVYTVLRHVSKSGMSRRIDLYAIAPDHAGEPRLQYLSGWVGRILEYRRHKDGGLVVGGCGMDMGFHLVYSLGRALWPNGTAEPHGTRNGSADSDGGYALRHEWI